MNRLPVRRVLFAMITSTIAVLCAAQAAGPAEHSAANPLDPIKRLVGGRWLCEMTRPDGSKGTIRAEYQWGLNGKIIQAQVFAGTEKDAPQMYETIFGYNAATKEIVFRSFAAGGYLFEGTAKAPEHDTCEVTFTEYSEAGKRQFRQVMKFTGDDEYKWSVFLIEGGESELYLEATWRRTADNP